METIQKREITIKGGGIAGLTAAINLAKAGWPATVHELRSQPGEHREGDFQGLENWTREENVLDSLRKFGIEITFPAKPWHEVIVVDAKRKKQCAHSERPLFYLIQRGSQENCLDTHIARQAEKAGVTILYNSNCRDEEADIIATGDTKKYLMIAHGYTFKTDFPNTCEVLLDNSLAPVAYAYLISLNGEATITTVLTRDFENAKAYLEKTVRAYEEIYQITMREAKPFACVGNFGVLSSNREKIIVGEAAGFQDALAGFGMRYAFESGYLAAQSIIENKNYWKLADQMLYPWVRARSSLINI